MMQPQSQPLQRKKSTVAKLLETNLMSLVQKHQQQKQLQRTSNKVNKDVKPPVSLVTQVHLPQCRNHLSLNR